MFKKIINLTLCWVLGLSLFFGTGVITSAEESPEGVQISIEDSEELLVDHLKSLPENIDLNEAIESYLEEHPVELKDSEDNILLNNEISLPEYIDEQIDEENFKAYDINENTQIIFTDGDLFFISEINEGPEEIVNSSTLLSQPNTTSMSTTTTTSSTKPKHVSHSYTLKSWTGLTLWTGYTSGWFTYNGRTVSAKEDYSYLKRGNLSTWTLSDKKSDARNISSTNAEIYIQGYASWGYYIGGQGITVEEKFVKIYIRSDQNGNISKHRTIK